MTGFGLRLSKYVGMNTNGLILCSKRLIMSSSKSPVSIYLNSFAKKEVIQPKQALPEEPKKPPGPFISFASAKRTELIKRQPELKFADIGRQCGLAWKALSEEEKNVYRERYAKEQQNFLVVKDVWWNHLNAAQKEHFLKTQEEEKESKLRRQIQKTKKALGKPKKALSAYALFVSKYPRAKDINSMEFITLAEEDSRRYKNERPFWKLKFLQQGNGHLLRLLNKRLESLKTRHLKTSPT